MKTETDSGVILRIRPYSEYDALVTFFSLHHGKITFLARGIRRPTSKSSGLFQPFATLQYEKTKETSETKLSKILKPELIQKPPEYFEDIFFLAELSEKISQEGEVQKDFFELLQEVGNARYNERFPSIFLIKILSIFGFLPQIYYCHECHEKFSGDVFFENQGSFVCAHHKSVARFGAGENAPLFTFEEIKTLSFWQRGNILDAEKVSVSGKFCEKVKRIFLEFLKREQNIFLKSVS